MMMSELGRVFHPQGVPELSLSWSNKAALFLSFAASGHHPRCKRGDSNPSLNAAEERADPVSLTSQISTLSLYLWLLCCLTHTFKVPLETQGFQGIFPKWASSSFWVSWISSFRCSCWVCLLRYREGRSPDHLTLQVEGSAVTSLTPWAALGMGRSSFALQESPCLWHFPTSRLLLLLLMLPHSQHTWSKFQCI